MSDTLVKAVDFLIEDVGKHMKSTKKRYTWKFQVKNQLHVLVCEASLVSGKVKLVLDGRPLISSDLVNTMLFQYNFTLEGSSMIVLQQSSQFELRIDNKTFTHILGQQKTRKQFKTQQETVESNTPTQNFALQNNGQMINLNLGLIGNGMKKKKNVQSDNWKDMHEDSIDYFKKLQETSNKIYAQINQTLPQQDKGKEQKIMEQFNTMQQLFATATPQSLAQQKKNNNALNLMEDFNTMQQLFLTNIQGNTQIKQQTVNVPKEQEFSTMQQLFSTIQPINKIEVQKKAQEFCTMQELFKTLQCQNSEKKEISTGEDFNTIRNLFQTLNMNAQPVAQESSYAPINKISEKQPQKQINISNSQLPDYTDFNTMANLFKTSSLPIPQAMNALNQVKEIPKAPKNIVENQSQENTNPNLPNYKEFSTLANLFQTNNLPALGKPQKESQTCLNEVKNVQQININDFNTMQNLFKTIGSSQIPTDWQGQQN